MIELAQHIEALLLENDCVIVPGLGGFVGHYTSSTQATDEPHQLLPPTRVIGFNPSLKMNDGLLVQSYASVYGTSFSDATRRVEYQVSQLLHQLHEDGKVELPNIGELHYSIYDTFSFLPYDHKLTTPYLYGMCSFELPELSPLASQPQPKPVVMQPAPIPASPVIPTPRRSRRQVQRSFYLHSVTSVVAAILLFFLITTPIENTGVIESNYAQLMPSELFAKLGQTSLVTTPVNLATAQNPKVTRPVVAKEVKVAPVSTPRQVPDTAAAKPAPKAAAEHTARKAEAPRPIENPYYIIIASVSTESDAHQLAKQLREDGYSTACALKGGGKMRVSIQTCRSHQEAYQSLKSIRTQKAYQNAWVLH